MGNKNDRWSALSMSDRADLIKLYVNNGITSLDIIKKDYNSFGDGGDTEGDDNNDSTTPERKLTLEEFLQAKADSTRVAALESSRNRTEGVEIVYPLSEVSKEINRRALMEYYYADPNFIGPILEYQNHPHDRTMWYQAKKELDNNCDYGLNCIGTATDNYPEDSREVVNKTFRENPANYGFVEVPYDNVLPGDIVQVGNHGMIFDSFAGDIPLFNYSNGNIGPDAYVKQGQYPADYYSVFRYVGTPTLIQQWTEEYNAQNKKFGGKINRFNTGGPTREMTPSEAAAINKILNNSQYMLAVGDSPDDPAYLSTDYLEPAVVKAFDSNEDYNRYYGEQFGKQIAKKRDKVANNIMRALEYTPFVGDGIDAANTIASINEGDYSKAAVLAGLALLPNAIEKPLKGAKKIGRSITHAFSSDYLPTILSDKFGRGVINPSMAVSPATKTFDNLYGDIVLVGDKTLLDDSFLFRGDGDTSAVGWFTDAYDEVRDVHKVSSQMRAHDVNSPVPQLTKERFLELEAHPEYHEAKRNRITGLNEFKHALVPEEFMQNQEMLEYLNEMGIPYSSYSEGNKVQAINAFLEKHPELLFKCGGKLNKN